MEVSPPEEPTERAPVVFVSYSHDSKEHKAWVAAFANKLLENGVDVLLDQLDVEPGDNIGSFIHNAFKTADRVLMICTETYVRKADDGTGGAGYEAMIVTAELIKNLGQRKFIPVIRQSGGGKEVPMCVELRSYINLSEGHPDYEEQFQVLLKSLHQIPIVAKSLLGKSPFSRKAFEGEQEQASR